jgi:hypothetical protein
LGMQMDPEENDRELQAPFMPFVAVSIDPNTGDRIIDSKLIDMIVEWLAAEVKCRGVLDHHRAAKATLERHRFQEVLLMGGLILEALERNDGNDTIERVYRFSEPVLDAFRKLTGKTVRWGKRNRYWVAVEEK